MKNHLNEYNKQAFKLTCQISISSWIISFIISLYFCSITEALLIAAITSSFTGFFNVLIIIFKYPIE